MPVPRPRLSRRARRAPVVLAATAALAGGLAVVPWASPAGASPAGAVRVGAVAVPAGARSLGALGGGTTLRVDVSLRPRDPAALAAFATAVSTPGSSLYRRYLSVSGFTARFGPTAATVAAVEAWLRGQGLRPASVSADHLQIGVTATAAQLERAFSVGIERYDVAGRDVYANTSPPRVAGVIAGAVAGVVGLDDVSFPAPRVQFTSRRAAPARLAPHVVTGGPQPCSAASTTGKTYGSLTADQLASAYRFSSLYGAGDLGAGQTVALFELEPDLTSDISAYQSCYKTAATVTYTKEDGGAGSGAGAGEAALDIEDVIGLAPKASIDVFQAPNTNTGLVDDYTAIVDDAAVSVVSTSWGECEASSTSTILADENTLFEQAASEGKSVFAAAGDNGSEDCGKTALGVDDPASQPYVTGVGGTKITSLGPPPAQTVWNENLLGAGAGGGGISEKWAMPSYQSGAPASLNVVNSSSSGTPCKAASGSYCREVPDVSADADPFSGYVVYYSGSWTPIGGTSAAAPLWAAFMALTNASAACGGKAVGFADPALYKAAASSYTSRFSDVTSGNNDYKGSNGGKFTAGTGYDMASGLGTPVGGALATALCSSGSGGNTITVTNPGKQTTTVGTSVSLQIKAKDSGGLALAFSSTGLPKGLRLNHATGLITGSPVNAGTNKVTVTAKDSTGASGSTTFTWSHPA